jgi:hypothetical protein
MCLCRVENLEKKGNFYHSLLAGTYNCNLAAAQHTTRFCSKARLPHLLPYPITCSCLSPCCYISSIFPPRAAPLRLGFLVLCSIGPMMLLLLPCSSFIRISARLRYNPTSSPRSSSVASPFPFALHGNTDGFGITKRKQRLFSPRQILTVIITTVHSITVYEMATQPPRVLQKPSSDGGLAELTIVGGRNMTQQFVCDASHLLHNKAQ